MEFILRGEEEKQLSTLAGHIRRGQYELARGVLHSLFDGTSGGGDAARTRRRLGVVKLLSDVVLWGCCRSDGAAEQWGLAEPYWVWGRDVQVAKTQSVPSLFHLRLLAWEDYVAFAARYEAEEGGAAAAAGKIPIDPAQPDVPQFLAYLRHGAAMCDLVAAAPAECALPLGSLLRRHTRAYASTLRAPLFMPFIDEAEERRVEAERKLALETAAPPPQPAQPGAESPSPPPPQAKEDEPPKKEEKEKTRKTVRRKQTRSGGGGGDKSSGGGGGGGGGGGSGEPSSRGPRNPVVDTAAEVGGLLYDVFASEGAGFGPDTALSAVAVAAEAAADADAPDAAAEARRRERKEQREAERAQRRRRRALAYSVLLAHCGVADDGDAVFHAFTKRVCDAVRARLPGGELKRRRSGDADTDAAAGAAAGYVDLSNVRDLLCHVCLLPGEGRGGDGGAGGSSDADASSASGGYREKTERCVRELLEDLLRRSGWSRGQPGGGCGGSGSALSLGRSGSSSPLVGGAGGTSPGSPERTSRFDSPYLPPDVCSAAVVAPSRVERLVAEVSECLLAAPRGMASALPLLGDLFAKGFVGAVAASADGGVAGVGAGNGAGRRLGVEGQRRRGPQSRDTRHASASAAVASPPSDAAGERERAEMAALLDGTEKVQGLLTRGGDSVSSSVFMQIASCLAAGEGGLPPASPFVLVLQKALSVIDTHLSLCGGDTSEEDGALYKALHPLLSPVLMQPLRWLLIVVVWCHVKGVPWNRKRLNFGGVIQKLSDLPGDPPVDPNFRYICENALFEAKMQQSVAGMLVYAVASPQGEALIDHLLATAAAAPPSGALPVPNSPASSNCGDDSSARGSVGGGAGAGSKEAAYVLARVLQRDAGHRLGRLSSDADADGECSRDQISRVAQTLARHRDRSLLHTLQPFLGLLDLDALATVLSTRPALTPAHELQKLKELSIVRSVVALHAVLRAVLRPKSSFHAMSLIQMQLRKIPLPSAQVIAMTHCVRLLHLKRSALTEDAAAFDSSVGGGGCGGGGGGNGTSTSSPLSSSPPNQSPLHGKRGYLCEAGVAKHVLKTLKDVALELLRTHPSTPLHSPLWDVQQQQQRSNGSNASASAANPPSSLSASPPSSLAGNSPRVGAMFPQEFTAEEQERAEALVKMLDQGLQRLELAEWLAGEEGVSTCAMSRSMLHPCAFLAVALRRGDHERAREIRAFFTEELQDGAAEEDAPDADADVSDNTNAHSALLATLLYEIDREGGTAQPPVTQRKDIQQRADGHSGVGGSRSLLGPASSSSSVADQSSLSSILHASPPSGAFLQQSGLMRVVADDTEARAGGNGDVSDRATTEADTALYTCVASEVIDRTLSEAFDCYARGRTEGGSDRSRGFGRSEPAELVAALPLVEEAFLWCQAAPAATAAEVSIPLSAADEEAHWRAEETYAEMVRMKSEKGVVPACPEGSADDDSCCDAFVRYAVGGIRATGSADAASFLRRSPDQHLRRLVYDDFRFADAAAYAGLVRRDPLRAAFSILCRAHDDFDAALPHAQAPSLHDDDGGACRAGRPAPPPPPLTVPILQWFLELGRRNGGGEEAAAAAAAPSSELVALAAGVLLWRGAARRTLDLNYFACLSGLCGGDPVLDRWLAHSLRTLEHYVALYVRSTKEASPLHDAPPPLDLERVVPLLGGARGPPPSAPLHPSHGVKLELLAGAGAAEATAASETAPPSTEPALEVLRRIHALVAGPSTPGDAVAFDEASYTTEELGLLSRVFDDEVLPADPLSASAAVPPAPGGFFAETSERFTYSVSLDEALSCVAYGDRTPEGAPDAALLDAARLLLRTAMQLQKRGDSETEAARALVAAACRFLGRVADGDWSVVLNDFVLSPLYRGVLTYPHLEGILQCVPVGASPQAEGLRRTVELHAAIRGDVDGEHDELRCLLEAAPRRQLSDFLDPRLVLPGVPPPMPAEASAEHELEVLLGRGLEYGAMKQLLAASAADPRLCIELVLGAFEYNTREVPPGFKDAVRVWHCRIVAGMVEAGAFGAVTEYLADIDAEWGDGEGREVCLSFASSVEHTIEGKEIVAGLGGVQHEVLLGLQLLNSLSDSQHSDIIGLVKRPDMLAEQLLRDGNVYNVHRALLGSPEEVLSAGVLVFYAKKSMHVAGTSESLPPQPLLKTSSPKFNEEDELRQKFLYAQAPCLPLCKTLIAMIADDFVAGQVCLEIADELNTALLKARHPHKSRKWTVLAMEELCEIAQGRLTNVAMLSDAGPDAGPERVPERRASVFLDIGRERGASVALPAAAASLPQQSPGSPCGDASDEAFEPVPFSGQEWLGFCQGMLGRVRLLKKLEIMVGHRFDINMGVGDVPAEDVAAAATPTAAAAVSGGGGSKTVLFATLGVHDLLDALTAGKVVEGLLSWDRMELALEVATKCGVSADVVWVSWGKTALCLGWWAVASACFAFAQPSAVACHLDYIQETLEGPAIQRHATFNQESGELEYLKAAADAAAAAPGEEKGAQGLDVAPAGDYNLKGVGKEEAIRLLSSAIPATPRQHPTEGLNVQRAQQALYYTTRYGSDEQIVEFHVRRGDLGLAVQHVLARKLSTYFMTKVFLPMRKKGTAGIATLRAGLLRQDASLLQCRSLLYAVCKHLRERIKRCSRDCDRAVKTSLLGELSEWQQWMGDHARCGMTQIDLFLFTYHSWFGSSSAAAGGGGEPEVGTVTSSFASSHAETVCFDNASDAALPVGKKENRPVAVASAIDRMVRQLDGAAQALRLCLQERQPYAERSLEKEHPAQRLARQGMPPRSGDSTGNLSIAMSSSSSSSSSSSRGSFPSRSFMSYAGMMSHGSFAGLDSSPECSPLPPRHKPAPAELAEPVVLNERGLALPLCHVSEDDLIGMLEKVDLQSSVLRLLKEQFAIAFKAMGSAAATCAELPPCVPRRGRKASTLFGSYEDQVAVAVRVLVLDFAVGFQTIRKLDLPRTQTFREAVLSLASRREEKKLESTLRNMTNTLPSSDLDDMVLECVEKVCFGKTGVCLCVYPHASPRHTTRTVLRGSEPGLEDGRAVRALHLHADD